jgi:hypothetical protein
MGVCVAPRCRSLLRMSGRRGRVAAGVVVVALLVVAGFAWTSRGDDARYEHTLVRYDDHHGEPNRYVNLGDDDAQLAVGSPDRHRIVVQWRDPDGHGWTSPQTVWTDRKNTAVDNTVRFGGGTVAILQTFTPDVHEDSDIGAVSVAIVCRRLSCQSARAAGSGGEAQVTPDGRTAYLGQDERVPHLWTAGDGIHVVRWSNHPGFEYGVVSPSEPVLAPDGSLRVVSSRPSRGSCTFELLTSPAGSADLSSSGRFTEPVRGRGRSDCSSYLLTYSEDWVEVHPSDHRALDFWFVRNAQGWQATHHDASGLQHVAGARGCCETSVQGFVHWNDVAFASPDGHRILVQSHFLGDETWRDAMVLDGAPASARCTWMDGHEVGDHGFAVLLTCHTGAVANQFRGDAYAVAATSDLRHWQSRYVTGVRTEPQVTDGQLRVGATTWSPEDGFSG